MGESFEYPKTHRRPLGDVREHERRPVVLFQTTAHASPLFRALTVRRGFHTVERGGWLFSFRSPRVSHGPGIESRVHDEENPSMAHGSGAGRFVSRTARISDGSSPGRFISRTTPIADEFELCTAGRTLGHRDRPAVGFGDAADETGRVGGFAPSRCTRTGRTRERRRTRAGVRMACTAIP